MLGLSHATIAVVGMEPMQAEKIQILLHADAGVPRTNIHLEKNYKEFHALLDSRTFDVVIIGLATEAEKTLETIRMLSSLSIAPAIVCAFDYEDLNLATAVLAAGAQDVIVKRVVSGLSLSMALVHGMERARMRAEQRTTSQRLIRLNEEMNRFLGMAAHDLRGPIGMIGSFAELVLADDAGRLGPNSLAALQTIQRSSAAMVRLIEELLDMSRIESGKYSLQYSRVKINEFLDQCVRRNSRMALQKEIALEVECRSEVEIAVDVDKMSQVMDNLISNAIKFSRPGSKVYIEGLTSIDEIEVRVRDWGPGISEEETKQLFTPFFRGAARPTAGEQSTGLGLPIVKRLVAEHNGKVGAISEVGTGSVFWFRIPHDQLSQSLRQNWH